MEERDHLEIFITENKELLDVYLPEDDLWDKINADLHPTPQVLTKPNRWTWVFRSAAVFVLLIAAVWAIIQFGRPETVTPEMRYTEELVEAESYYTSVIDKHREEILQYKKKGIEGDEQFWQNSEELTQMYQELRKELVNGENQEAVIKAMMQNLMTQMEMLQSQLEILAYIQSIQEEHQDENRTSL